MIGLSPRILLALASLSFTSVTILLFPLYKQASSWNRCLAKTTESLMQVQAFQKMDDQSKEVLSVMICNGAVFEPKLKPNIK